MLNMILLSMIMVASTANAAPIGVYQDMFTLVDNGEGETRIESTNNLHNIRDHSLKEFGFFRYEEGGEWDDIETFRLSQVYDNGKTSNGSAIYIDEYNALTGYRSRMLDFSFSQSFGIYFEFDGGMYFSDPNLNEDKQDSMIIYKEVKDNQEYYTFNVGYQFDMYSYTINNIRADLPVTEVPEPALLFMFFFAVIALLLMRSSAIH